MSYSFHDELNVLQAFPDNLHCVAGSCINLPPAGSVRDRKKAMVFQHFLVKFPHKSPYTKFNLMILI